MRCRYHALLQIVGFLAVVAFHAEVSWMSRGWFAVELFFALAGYNMAGALQGRFTLEQYARARYRRLALPLLVLVPAVALLVVKGSSSAATYALTAPLQLHNLMRVVMTELRDLDMAWLPTWFVAALFQLQLLAFVLRRVLVSASLPWIVCGVAGSGVVFRLALGELLGGVGKSLTFVAADAIYWAPITHVEALVGGLMLGLGRLTSRGLLGTVVPVCLLASGLALVSAGELPLKTFPLGSGSRGEHVWGYLLLAMGAVVLIDKRQPLARWVLGLQLSPALDRGVVAVSQLTFMAYLVHGSVLAVGSRVLRRVPYGSALLATSVGPLVITVCVAVLSLLLAAAVERLFGVARQAWVARRA